jgi:predicted DCC family thiol-disulfide oxidoreductase YuxK
MAQHRQIQVQHRSPGECRAGADFLLYDGDCPACSAYVAMSRLRQRYPGLRVLSARTEPALVTELRGKGYEINEGMALCLDGVIHYGPDATRMIAVLGRSCPFRWRRAALASVGTAPWAQRLYPWLNRMRFLLLRMLGRKPVD